MAASSQKPFDIFKPKPCINDTRVDLYKTSLFCAYLKFRLTVTAEAALAISSYLNF
jgi:hypothetical protein